MPYVARLYDSRQTADAAADALRKRGFDPHSVHVIEGSRTSAPAASAPEPAEEHDAAFDPDAVPAAHRPAPSAHDGGSGDAHVEEMRKAGVAPAHAAVYAEGLRRGETLVVVHPPFTMGEVATGIMDGFHPIAVDVPHAEHHGHSGDADWSGDAAPLSKSLGWKVLSSDPAPLSTYLGWRTVLPESTSSATLDTVRRQSQHAAPLSAAVKLPTLSGNAAPLSSATGWRPLSDDPAPLSERLKWRTLLGDPSPLSGKLGWRTISNNPTPLSSLLGLTVLTKRQ